MINSIRNWWRSQKFRAAIKQGDYHQARKIFKEIQKSGAKLSWEEKLFKDRLKLEKILHKKNETLKGLYQRLEELELQLGFGPFQELSVKHDEQILFPDEKFIDFLSKTFKLIERDKNLLECTGIDRRVFDDFEADLTEFIKKELKNVSREKKVDYLLKEAIDDLNKLKQGEDPEYRFELSPHVYLMRYFLENVYCAYLAWFLIYKAGLLPTQINILDIAAGPGTIAYGLALLLQSSNGFFPMPPMHISYYSLEQQKSFQYWGLKFWRQYMEPKAMNAYFRFDTSNLFDYPQQSSKLPRKFFDFIVISHCFFYEPDTRSQSNRIYQEIFTNSLKDSGYILLIIQDKKIFNSYNIRQSEDKFQEFTVITRFVNDLGLKLVWYKYVNSRNQRTSLSSAEFSKLVREKLPKQTSMSQLIKKYFKYRYEFSYALDDYVILAKR